MTATGDAARRTLANREAIDTRGHVCPGCERRWPQRDALFCGACGALLDDRLPASAPARRGTAALATRAILAAAALGLVVATVTTDLAPTAHGEPDVEVRDGVRTAPHPLTAAEEEALRLQADPDRLRCEPRGCELWRVPRSGASMATGVVELDGGLIAMLVGSQRHTVLDAETGEEQVDDRGHRLVAIDPASGEERWSRPIHDFGSVSGAYGWVRLLDGIDGGGLIVAGSTVTAFDADGTQRWVARAGIRGGAVRDIDDAAVSEDAVVVTGTILDRSSNTRYLTALQPRTAEVLWTADVEHVGVLDAEAIVVVSGAEDDGRLRALDHATGATVWDADPPDAPGSWFRPEGPWLAVQYSDGLALLDAATGDRLATVDGWLTSSLRQVDDRWLGVVREPDPDAGADWFREDTGSMALFALRSDGSVEWKANVGHVRPWWDCCPISVDRHAGTVSVIDPVRVQDHDLVTGRLLDARVTAREGDPSTFSDGLSALDVRRPRPDVEVVWHPDGGRVDIRMPDHDVIVRGGRRIDVASIDPIVVLDETDVMGIQPVPVP